MHHWSLVTGHWSQDMHDVGESERCCVQLPCNRQPRSYPLLKEEHRQSLPFEGVISGAQSDAVKDGVHSLPGYRATRKLAELYRLDPDAD